VRVFWVSLKITTTVVRFLKNEIIVLKILRGDLMMRLFILFYYQFISICCSDIGLTNIYLLSRIRGWSGTIKRKITI